VAERNDEPFLKKFQINIFRQKYPKEESIEKIQSGLLNNNDGKDSDVFCFKINNGT
jgi:hypothetical protein